MPQINLMELAEQSFGTSLEQLDDRRIYKLLVKLVQERSAACPLNNGKKKLYYISAEFLIGKLLINNMIDLGIYDEVKDQLTAAGHDLNKIEEFEVEPSLGNGGLGRLAACFLDSIATLGLTGDGVGLNYHYGLFRQRFVDNQQKAVPDEWLGEQDILVDDDRSYTVEFGDFAVTSKLVNIDVPGYGQPTKNRLRLFDLASVDDGLVPGSSIDFDKTEIAKNLTLFLYPDDSDEQGRLLRIYQEYFMVSNAAQLLIDEAIERGSNLHDLADYAVVQINDTHPTMVIPELIRLLTTEHGIEFDEAVTIVRSMVAYTNHTILAEALEKWPIELFSRLLPRIYQIVEEINRRFLLAIEHKFPGDQARKDRMAIIHDGQVRMAFMACAASFSINGVAKIHTEILEKQTLRDFYELSPEKFNNKTNGITQRRFLMHGNPLLADWVTKHIGDGWITELMQLARLVPYASDAKAQKEFMEIKRRNKVRLAEYIKEHNGIEVDPDSIFDVQVKRLHEYKRQFLNILHVMYLYNELKANPQMDFYPRTFIFGAKAAAGYRNAKLTIKLINSVADVINNDADIKGKIKVVFIEDYRVSNAEWIFAAADVSEQISTASKEASGTGNMKFMLNGALTLGTMDGANVEMAEEVGMENIFIFGMSSEEVIAHERNRDYDPMQIYNSDEGIRKVVNQLVDGTFSPNDPGLFRDLYNSLLNTQCTQYADTYFILKDFRSYVDAQKRIVEYYQDKQAWAKSAILNTAHAGKFSSDRTIQEYVDEIWHLDHITVPDALVAKM